MVSTLLEIAGFGALVGAFTILGLAVAGCYGALFGGLLVLGVVLLVSALALTPPARKRQR